MSPPPPRPTDDLLRGPWARRVEDGWRLTVRAQPGAKRTEIVGEHDGALRIRLAAPPVDGKANAELVRFLARQLGRRAREVTVVSGVASRDKVVAVADPVDLGGQRPDSGGWVKG